MSTDLQNALSAVTGSPPHAIPRHKAPYRHGHSELHVGLRVSSTCAYRDCRLVCRGLRLNGASDPSLSSNPTPHCTAHRARCPPRLISPPPSQAPTDGVAAASGRSQRGRRCRARIPKAERFGAVEERRKWSDREGQHAARRRELALVLTLSPRSCRAGLARPPVRTSICEETPLADRPPEHLAQGSLGAASCGAVAVAAARGHRHQHVAAQERSCSQRRERVDRCTSRRDCGRRGRGAVGAHGVAENLSTRGASSERSAR